MTRKNNSKLISLFALMSLLVLLAATGASASFSAGVETITSRTMPGGFTEYSLTIDNHRNFDQAFEVRPSTADAINWISITTPSRVLVPANTEETFILTLIPRSGAPLGSYSVNIRIQGTYDDSVETLRVPASITVDGAPAGFVPSVAMELDIPDSHDPRNLLSIPVKLRNRNQLDISELVITASSELFDEPEQSVVSLTPNQERTVYMAFSLDPMQLPGEYNLRVSAYYPLTERVITESFAKINIASYTLTDTDYDKQTRLFLSTENITVTNKGNFERVNEIEIRAPWYKRIFTSVSPEAELVRVDGKAYYQWSPFLAPGESYNIIVTSNYRLLIIIILIILISVASYYLFRSPVIILKEASVIGEDEEGVSELKVKIFVKNRSGRPVHSLTVNDKLPGIIELSEPHHLGSLKPTKVTKTSKKGTLLYWNLDSLESLEERILTYRAKSKLRIIGNLTLPRVRAKFESRTGRERIVFSARPFFVKE